MSILRLSTLSLTLAVAVFALGYNRSFADKPVNDQHDHGGGDDPATVFDVAMQPTDVVEDGTLGLLISNGACGTTEDQGQRELDVSFPATDEDEDEDECVTVDVSFITPPTGGPLTLRAFGLIVRSNKSDVLIFLTDGEIIDGHLVPDTAGVYVSERLSATISRNGSITVAVNMDGLAVEKNHQPRKGELVGPIAIGEIVYTPIE
jgi:hypothetical protein